MKRILSIILIISIGIILVSCGNKEAQLPKVVKIGRTDCIPCRDLSKILDQLKPKIEGKATIEIINLEDYPNAMQEYDVEGIPTMLFFNSNEDEVYRFTGVKTEEEIVELLKQAGMK